MKVLKDEIYYYIHQENNVIIKLRALRTAESEIMLGFEIVEYILGTPKQAGHADVLQPDMHISINQLFGPSISGASKFIFTEYNSIKFIFKFL